ncbi:hypothetical protein Q7P35_006850 [Cladosporium inversicolor]
MVFVQDQLSGPPIRVDRREIPMSRRTRPVIRPDSATRQDNIYPKVEDWFDVIGKVLGNDAIVAENVYNMDETGVMLSMLGSVNVLVGKDDHRDYRERDAHALDDPGKQSIQRHLRKLTKGAQTSIARGVLQQERIRSLLKTNDEAKFRRTTKSLVLGKAKVMSFEDLIEARTKRAAKDARKAAKKQRRKRKSDQEVVPDAAL